MSTFVKKILVSAVAAVVVATVVMPPTAQAQTAAELNAQIQSLLATIAQLQAQLGGVTGGGFREAGIPAGFMFTRNLSQGTTGSDVMYLQILLNSNPSTQVAATGVGSKGQETQFYGPLTARAVSSFQMTYASTILAPLGLSSGTGFFGASSRAKANALLASSPVTPVTPPGPITPPSPITPPITTPGVEGSIIATIASTPASGATLTLNQSKAVGAVDVKATGSDVLVSRLDLQFDVRPYLYISEVTVSDGSTSRTMAVTSANTTEVTVGSKYSFRVDGLNILVPKDATKTLTVTVKSATGLPAGTTTKDLVMTFIQNSVRGTDGAGLTQTAPTADLSTRTFTVKEGDTASLELSSHSSNPKARPVIVQSTTETADIVLAVFNLKATGNDAILRTFQFNDSVASGTLDVVGLYDGSTLLSSTSSIVNATSVLSNVNLTIPKDTTKTLTLKGSVKKAQGNYESAGSSTIDAGAASSSITISAESLSISAEDVTSFATATVTGSDVSSQAGYFYTKAPTLAVVSTSITGLVAPSGSLTPQQAEAKIRVNVTANGGDVYIGQSAGNQNASNGIMVATSSISASTTFTGETITSNAEVAVASEMWVVRAGDTKYFEWSAIVTDAITAVEGMQTVGKNVAPQITDLRWGDTQAEGYGNGMSNWPDTDFWTNYKTSSLFLQAPN